MVDDAVIARSYADIADLYIRLFGDGVNQVDPDDLDFLRRHFAGCAGPVLDVGCGPGHLTAYLNEIGVATRGVDLVPEFVANARSRWPTLQFEVGSMLHLDLPTSSLDGVLAWYSLIHCEPADLAPVLAQFASAIRPGGVLVVGFFVGDRVEPFAHKVTTAYRWPMDEMSEALAATGFTEVARASRPRIGETRPHGAIAARGSI